MDTTGDAPTIYLRDLVDFPGFFGAGRSAFGGQSGLAAGFNTTATHVFCVEPLKYIGHDATREDIEVFQTALAGSSTKRRSCPRWRRGRSSTG